MRLNLGDRPLGLWLLTGSLLISPLIHLTTLATGSAWLNFGSRRVWDNVVYLAIAPLVGYFLATRHSRARFSVYVFLSCELIRAHRIESWMLAALAALATLYLQTPGARRVHPRVKSREVLGRLGISERRAAE